MPSLSSRQRRALARSAAVGELCWDAPRAIQERVDKLCASDGYTGKYITQTINAIGANDTVTFRFTAPGAFCPSRMLIFAFDAATGALVDLGISLVKIKVGIEQQVLPIGSRSSQMVDSVPAELFSSSNTCCPVFCPPCICAPQVPLQVEFANGSGVAIDVAVVLLGEYLDIPPDQFQFNMPDRDGCCPPPSSDKLMGFIGSLGTLETLSIVLTTPGEFCPRQLFLAFLGPAAPHIVIDSIRTGLDETIISGSLPASLFTTDNDCCVLTCPGCICMPGYPLTIDLRNTHNEFTALVAGALVGCYTDACPPGM